MKIREFRFNETNALNLGRRRRIVSPPVIKPSGPIKESGRWGREERRGERKVSV